MNQAIKKIVIALLLIVVTPAAFFTLYELNSINKTEQLLQNAYGQQLESILFSLNTFTYDVVTRVKDEVQRDRLLLLQPGTRSKGRHEIESIGLIAFTDSTLHITSHEYRDTLSPEIRKKLLSTITGQQTLAHKLTNYAAAKYYRVESIPVPDMPDYFILAFVNSGVVGKTEFGFIAIDRELFVGTILQQRISMIAAKDFLIGLFSRQSVIASSDFFPWANVEKHTPVWVVPNCEWGISLRDASVKDIAKDRMRLFGWLVAFIAVLIGAGIVFLYRSARREIVLAQMKADFVSNVSHELRTPLSLIGMFAETLEAGRVRTEEKKFEYYKIIHQETQRLSRIVAKILNFSQIEAGKKKFNFEQHNLNEVLRGVLNDYEYHLKQKGFSLTTYFSDEALIVAIDNESIIETIINLLDNAVKYSSDIKEITISTGLINSEAVMSIADRGIGITPADQKHIFEKFYRVTEGNLHPVKGTGLGLSIVHYIIEAHHGRITVNSAPGTGSTFTVYLPVTMKG